MLPRRTLLTLTLALALALPRPALAQTHDPTLSFSTLELPHCRVHYYVGLEVLANRVGSIVEGVYATVGDLMGWRPRQRIELLLTDNTDDGNGFAIVVPYNTIRLWAAAPEDLSELGDYGDYLQQLVTHEFTHIAHMDNITGIPAIINAVLGKVYPPNSLQPSWMLEGIAVYSETRNTDGGRLRGSLWDMYMRADALADHFAGIDQVSSGGGLRWPHGDIVYLYGSHFIDYIVHRFGEHALADMSAYQGGQLIPGGINREARHATGHTLEDLYPEFLQSLRERYAAQRAAIEARGLREGERITFQGEYVRYPRFLGDGHTVAYESSDGESHPQIRTIGVGTIGGRVETPVNGDPIDAMSGFALNADGTEMVVSDTGYFRDIYAYRDLYHRDVRPNQHGTLRTFANRTITDGARATYPDISPDGDHVAFTVDHRSTSSLYEMSLTDHEPHALFRVPRYEQVYTPRYSPDGRSIVFSQWQTGGYRDIRIFDRETGVIRDLMHDRALDIEPIFSPDGRWIVWSSDRTGVANLYAMELATGTVRQVTNVLTGAFMPALSPDCQTLVYVGYGAAGFDLYRMRFDPALWLDPGEPRVRSGQPIPTPPVAGTVHAYSPWNTLRPRTYSLSLGSDGFGPQLSILTQGNDIVGNHSYSARFSLGLTRGDPSFDISYFYSGMRPTLRLHVYRNVFAAQWHVGNTDQVYALDEAGGETELSVPFPAPFMSNTLGIVYEAQYVHVLGALPYENFLDPNTQPAPTPPFQGWNVGLRAYWSVSTVHRYAYSISNQDGFEGSLVVHGTDPAFGSRYGSFDVSGAGVAYLEMPWGYRKQRHILAVRVAGGLGVSDAGAYNIFSLGGFPTYAFTDFLNSFLYNTVSSGVALRGYPQFARGGSSYYLANIEYRFPIIHIDHGASTLPVYLTRLYASAALDVGNAYNGAFQVGNAAVGVGADLLADVIVGWYYAFTVRLGIAEGLTGNDATTQVYVLLSSPF